MVRSSPVLPILNKLVGVPELTLYELFMEWSEIRKRALLGWGSIELEELHPDIESKVRLGTVLSTDSVLC